MDWPTLSRAMNRSPTYARIHGRCTRPMETTGTPADTASPGSAKRVSTTPSSGARGASWSSRISTVPRTRSVSPWRRHPEPRATAASAKACAVLLTLRATSASRLQPVDGVEGDAALAPDLEVQVGSLIARPAPDMAEDLPFGDSLPFGDCRVIQVAVEAVIAAAVIDQNGFEVGAEGSRKAHEAARDAADGGAGRRRDSDAVPRQAGVVRACGGAELVHDASLHGPVELAQVRGGDGGAGSGGAAGFRLTPGSLEGHDAVVQALLVALELGQTLQGLPRTAPRLAQRRLPLALERQVAVQLFRALVLAPSQHVARVDQRLPLPADAPLQLRHLVRQQAILPAHPVQVIGAAPQA